MTIDIVDFPIKNGGSFHCYVSSPEGNGSVPFFEDGIGDHVEWLTHCGPTGDLTRFQVSLHRSNVIFRKIKLENSGNREAKNHD